MPRGSDSPGTDTGFFLDAVGKGNPREAVERLARKHAADVYAYVLSITRDRTASEDLTQETFLRAYQGARAFQGKSRLRTWLIGIARNVTFNWMKRERPREAARSGPAGAPGSPCPAAPALEATQPGPPDVTESQELLRLVWEHVEGLPPAEREVLTLFYRHGMSHSEIAEVTGRRPGAVRVALFRALDRLRSRLAEFE